MRAAKRMHNTLFLSLLLFFVLCPSTFAATSFLETSGWLGVAASHFRYAEFDAEGRRLLTEKGFLPGFQAGIGLNWEKWFLNGELDYSKGKIDYAGQTNTGASLLTRTDEEITTAGITAGGWIIRNDSWRFGLHCGLGHRWWWRDINSAGTVKGLSETYTSLYGLIGARLEHSFSDRVSASLMGHLIIPIDPAVEARFFNRDDVTLKLEEKTGYSIAAALGWQWTESMQIVLRPSYTLWKFGKSETQPLTWHDIPVGTVYEPASETQTCSVELTIVHSF
jgi:hypothetical protein